MLVFLLTMVDHGRLPCNHYTYSPPRNHCTLCRVNLPVICFEVPVPLGKARQSIHLKSAFMICNWCEHANPPTSHLVVRTVSTSRLRCQNWCNSSARSSYLTKYGRDARIGSGMDWSPCWSSVGKSPVNVGSSTFGHMTRGHSGLSALRTTSRTSDFGDWLLN